MPEPTLALVHAVAPPVPGGTNVVLARLLPSSLPWRLEIFTDVAHRRRERARPESLLPGRYRHFLRLGGRPWRTPGLRSALDALDVPLAVAAGVRVALALRRSPAGCVLSVNDNGFSQFAGAVAALLLGRPHVLIVFDLWEENAHSATARQVARVLERAILRRAAAVVVFCVEAADHLRAKHGVECEVIDTPIDAAPEAAPYSAGKRPLEILVGGAIYWAQEESVRRLLRAAAAVPEVTVTIVGDEGSLRAQGLFADAYEATLPGTAFQARLRRADVLFLGLSLCSPHPEVIRTATPARLPECMATGRPLLVHAPAGSHAAVYARTEDFAEVVDIASDEALERGIRSIVDRPGCAARRAERAAQLARERHDAEAVRAVFSRLLARIAAGERSSTRGVRDTG